MKVKEFAQQILAEADIKINGKRSWDIQVYDERFYDCVLRNGSLGLGESYMDRWWDVECLDEFTTRLLRAKIDKKVRRKDLFWNGLKAQVMNLQSQSRAFIVGEKHYDVGNDLYERMLDKRLTYTCGYWKNAKNLDEAQEAKLDLVCKKIGLKRGMSVLDIGCGWGSFAKYAAEKYKARVFGITISKEQVKVAEERCKGLDVEICLQDYRDVDEQFDRVISLGMFEHVGHKNYRTYMEVVNRCLKEKGFFLLHTIGMNRSVKHFDPWLDKYIFPNALIPSVKQIAESVENIFVMEDWHNFGSDYDKTLLVWFANFKKNWPLLKGKYDERFFRMWKYYLLTCAGTFRARENQLWQIVFSKGAVPGGYQSIR